MKFWIRGDLRSLSSHLSWHLTQVGRSVGVMLTTTGTDLDDGADIFINLITHNMQVHFYIALCSEREENEINIIRQKSSQ